MNIIDQYPTKTQTELLKQRTPNTLFEPMMQKDEYYWVHQNQLQRSALHFEAVSYKIGHTQQSDWSQAHRRSGRVNTSPTSNQPLQQTNTLLKAYAKKSFICNSLDQAPETEKTISLQNRVPAYFEPHKKHSLPHQKKSVLPLKTMRPRAPMNAPLRHHLFIQNQEAELSINLHDVTQKEQQKFILWIKECLKKQKLILKQFIINGVSQ